MHQKRLNSCTVIKMFPLTFFLRYWVSILSNLVSPSLDSNCMLCHHRLQFHNRQKSQSVLALVYHCSTGFVRYCRLVARNKRECQMACGILHHHSTYTTEHCRLAFRNRQEYQLACAKFCFHHSKSANGCCRVEFRNTLDSP